MRQDSFNRTLDFNTKLKYFIAAWALVEVVLIDAVYKFINVLNNQRIVHLPKGFDPSNVLWGDSVALNSLKLVIVCSFAFLFGITYTYLSRKVLEKDKASISIANAIFAVLGTFIVIILTIWGIAVFQHQDTQIHESIVTVVDAIRGSALIMGFLFAQIVGAGIFSFVGLSVGQKMVKNLNEEDKGRLLGIKWYHYLWLWIAISVYVQALLWLVYSTLHTIMLFIHHFRFADVIGASTGDQSSNNSFASLGYGLLFIYFIAIIIFYLMNYQREILSGERDENIVIKIGSSLVVAVVIPVLLVLYTAVGTSNVR